MTLESKREVDVTREKLRGLEEQYAAVQAAGGRLHVPWQTAIGNRNLADVVALRHGAGLLLKSRWSWSWELLVADVLGIVLSVLSAALVIRITDRLERKRATAVSMSPEFVAALDEHYPNTMIRSGEPRALP